MCQVIVLVYDILFLEALISENLFLVTTSSAAQAAAAAASSSDRPCALAMTEIYVPFQNLLICKTITQCRIYVGSRLLLELLHVHSSKTMLDYG
jgi:hypothetical protein